MRRIGRRPDELARTDRILKLDKDGLLPWQIAERIGSCRKSISIMLSKHKKSVSNKKEYESRRNPDARRGKPKGSYIVKHAVINDFLSMGVRKG